MGLDYLHRVCGIIHTDLKPENVIMSLTDREIEEIAKNGRLTTTKMYDQTTELKILAANTKTRENDENLLINRNRMESEKKQKKGEKGEVEKKDINENEDAETVNQEEDKNENLTKKQKKNLKKKQQKKKKKEQIKIENQKEEDDARKPTHQVEEQKEKSPSKGVMKEILNSCGNTPNKQFKKSSNAFNLNEEKENAMEPQTLDDKKAGGKG